ncbi:MCE family protein [Mycolicibacterium moriokaense]|nr:MCE family protein [Mycolicibacterium moriokaense]
MSRSGDRGMNPMWLAPVVLIAVIAWLVIVALRFSGTLTSYEPVTLVSDRAGLVMENGAKVRLRGVEIGRVGSIGTNVNSAQLQLKIDPAAFKFLPSNVEAEIKSTTAFGSKYVDLIVPDHPSPKPLAPGAVLHSRNVTVEVNTVFENLQSVLQAIDPAKLNAVLSAFADGVGGKGERLGEAITGANNVLLAVNPRMPTVQRNWQLLGQTSHAYSVAAQNILSVLDSLTTTSSSIADNQKSLDALLLSAVGFSQAGVNLIGGNQPNLVRSLDDLEPTTALLLKYSPSYTCLFQGAQWFLEHGGRDALGGNGKSVVMDVALLFGDDQYRYPDNLPITGAKGGPGGKPSCGSLPDPSANYPVRALVTDTGWGTGMDIRPNPGIGFPGYANYLPVTRAVPEPPSIRNLFGGPAPGPVPYPGAPPYGAQLYAPDGTPLWPGLPPAPPPGAPKDPGPRPGSEPFVVPAPAQTQPTPLPPTPLPQEAAPSP